MEKNYKIFFVILLVIILNLASSCTTKNQNLRLRIIANSNSTVDQENKLIVKSKVKQIIEEFKTYNYHIIENKLKEQLPFLSKMIKVELKNELFPAKSYEDTFLPSGYYETIVITIGEGKGKNFWTLLYPDFFNISFEDDHEIEYRSYLYDKFLNKE